MVHLCSQCGFRGKDSYHLKRHRMIHTGEKPFSCADCPYSTNNKYHLDRHVKVHDQSKTIECDDSECNYRFGTVAAFERHRIQHNRGAASASSKTSGRRKGAGAASYVCQHCDFRAMRKATLDQHFRDAHSDAAGSQNPPPMLGYGQELAGECVICQDDEATFTCLPCGHQCVCGSPKCTDGIMRNRRCPTCHVSVKALGRSVEVTNKLHTKLPPSPTCRKKCLVALDVSAATAECLSAA
eukprot:m.100587 g.100587  ORF g.100587 m.100587 type:complete len:240 (-) comp20686_c0_seq1:99-818(-)